MDSCVVCKRRRIDPLSTVFISHHHHRCLQVHWFIRPLLLLTYETRVLARRLVTAAAPRRDGRRGLSRLQTSNTQIGDNWKCSNACYRARGEYLRKWIPLHSALFLYCVCDRRQAEYHRNALSNHRGETHFHDCTEMGLEAIERLRFLASFPLLGTGKREGGKKTQPFNRFASHTVTAHILPSRRKFGTGNIFAQVFWAKKVRTGILYFLRSMFSSSKKAPTD